MLKGVPVAIMIQNTPSEAKGTQPITTSGYRSDSKRLAITKNTQTRARSMFIPISDCCCSPRWIRLPKLQP